MVVPAAIIGLLAVGSLTGALHGAVGGALLAAALGAVGAVVWRADAIPWRDIASWTIPLVAWVAVAWFALGSEALYLVAGAVAIVWLLFHVLAGAGPMVVSMGPTKGPPIQQSQDRLSFTNSTSRLGRRFSNMTEMPTPQYFTSDLSGFCHALSG
jgi:hypothetical protein